MIMDLIISFFGIILNIIVTVINIIPFNIDSVNTRFLEGVVWMFGSLNNLALFWDVSFMASCIATLLLFEVAWWTYEISIAVFHWIKLNAKHPGT